MSQAASSVESRALTLLGTGLGPEIVSSATGVSVSRISQLMSDPIFSAQVLELRFMSTVAHAKRDQAYDKIEDALILKIEELLPMMMRPMEILKAISVINAAKRRSSGVPDSLQQSSGVVNLTLPAAVVQQFTAQNLQVNIHNQVVRAQDQELVTIQSGNMQKLLTERKANDEISNRERIESTSAGS